MIRNRGPVSADEARPGPFGLQPVNVALLVAGLAAIVLGYILLDNGSTVAAPLLLMLGYAVLVPAGLLVGLRSAGNSRSVQGE